MRDASGSGACYSRGNNNEKNARLRKHRNMGASTPYPGCQRRNMLVGDHTPTTSARTSRTVPLLLLLAARPPAQQLLRFACTALGARTFSLLLFPDKI